MQKFIKKVSIILIVCISLQLTGCSQSKTGLYKVYEQNELIMYTNATFPPYEFIGRDGEIVGIDVDISEQIAKKLGVGLKIKNTEFNSIIASIKSGKGDIGIGAITKNKDREEVVDFSISYDISKQYMIIKEDSDIKYLEDLEGKKVAGEMGAVGYLMIEDCVNSGVLKGKGTTAKAYNNSVDAFLSLTKNKTDAVIVDESISEQLIKDQQGYKIIPLIDKLNNEYNGEFGVVVQKGNIELLNAINQTIEELKREDKIKEYKNNYENI